MTLIASPALFGSATAARRGHFAQMMDRMVEGRDREARRFSYGYALGLDEALVPAYGYERRSSELRSAARNMVA